MRAVALVLLALVVGATALTLMLAWRLAQGPLDMGWAARRIEAAANIPGEPTRLAIGHADMRWGGFADGPGQGLELTLDDVVVADPTGAPAATVHRVDLAVSMGRLLIGQLVPRAVAAEGLDLSLQRGLDGRIALDLGGLDLDDEEPASDQPGPSVADFLAELARPARAPGSRPLRPDLQHVEELRSIRLDGAVLHLRDKALGRPVRIDILSMDLRRRPRGGVTGTASGAIALGAVRATVALQAQLAPNGGTALQLAFAPLNATAVQSAEPALATADTLDAAVQGAATLHLDSALRPGAATLSLQSGGGRLGLAGALIGFDSLALEAQAEWTDPAWTPPQRLTLSRARAVVHAPGGSWPTTATLAGHLARAPDGYAGDVNGTIDHLAFADIAALWPKPLGGHVRPWLTANVTGGIARDGAIKAQFKLPPDLSGVTLAAIDATVRGDDVTIWWLRPAPPVEGAQAVMTFRDPELLDIAVTSAHQGPIALTNGQLHFTGMADKDQFLTLNLDLAGTAPDLLTLLKNPALPLLAKSPIPIRNPAGAIAGHLTVNLPMKDVVPFEEVRIQTAARLTDLHLGGLVAGRDLDHAAVQLDAGSDGLHAQGRGLVAGVPADMALDLDFRSGGPGQVVQKATAAARLTGAQLAAAGLETGSLMPSGSALLAARYTQRRDGGGDVALSADLHDAALAIAGWHKPAGTAAVAKAHVLLRGDRLAGIDQLGATGPGLALEAHVGMVGDRPLLLVLDRLALGSTQAQGQVRFPSSPGEPIRATLAGPMLDLAAVLADRPGPAAVDKPGAPWVADLRFDRVRIAEKDPAGLTGVVAHAEQDGRRITGLSLSSAGAEQLRATIRAEGRGRRLVVKAADGGGLLRAAGVADTVQGGQLNVDAAYDDTVPGTPLTGTAKMTEFNVRNAAVLGKMLQSVTVYGVVDALRGPGLVFSTLVLPFRFEGGVLELTDARAFSSSLGLTARGRIDTGRDTIDLQGTVVPAYVVNSLLGRIPLVGNLFRAEQGGGLLAVNYGLHGPLANPSVSVNPLSALTPGFLRGLFRIFE